MESKAKSDILGVRSEFREITGEELLNEDTCCTGEFSTFAYVFFTMCKASVASKSTDAFNSWLKDRGTGITIQK